LSAISAVVVSTVAVITVVAVVVVTEAAVAAVSVVVEDVVVVVEAAAVVVVVFHVAVVVVVIFLDAHHCKCHYSAVVALQLVCSSTAAGASRVKYLSLVQLESSDHCSVFFATVLHSPQERSSMREALFQEVGWNMIYLLETLLLYSGPNPACFYLNKVLCTNSSFYHNVFRKCYIFC
jgi:hypothetical protein